MKNGIIILNKEEGISSQGAVNRVKRLMNAEKAGHTGTLDPLATGVLPVLIGRAVKASEYLVTGEKHYGATLLLGVTTDTEDVTGNTLTESDVIPSEDAVLSAVIAMQGESMQTPPMYSAIKVGGKKLYELARDGKTVEREPRPITVYSISAKKINEREYYLDIRCSKGTYIRTLCNDIGAALGCGGVMKTLERLSVGPFGIDEAITLSQLEKMSEDERESLVIPIEKIFSEYEKVILSRFFARLARCGVEIYQKKIGTSFSIGQRIRLYDDGGFFALGEVRDYEDGEAIKPIKQFDIEVK